MRTSYAPPKPPLSFTPIGLYGVVIPHTRIRTRSDLGAAILLKCTGANTRLHSLDGGRGGPRSGRRSDRPEHCPSLYHRDAKPWAAAASLSVMVQTQLPLLPGGAPLVRTERITGPMPSGRYDSNAMLITNRS